MKRMFKKFWWLFLLLAAGLVFVFVKLRARQTAATTATASSTPSWIRQGLGGILGGVR